MFCLRGKELDMDNMFQDERVFPSVKFTSSNNSLSNERRKKIDELIKQKFNLLTSKGYIIGEDGKIYPPKNSMLDGLLGFVVGDALGVPVEFSNRYELQKNPVKEMRGFGTFKVPYGTWSDDTSMTLATFDSIVINGEIDYNDIMLRFSNWYNNSEYTATDEVFDIGNTIRKAILRFDGGVDALSCGGTEYYENGNGSLMRMLPIAYYLYSSNFSEEEEVNIINNVSSLTHGHKISCLGCKIYCDYVKQILSGSSKEKAMEFIKNQDYNLYYSKDVVDKYSRILSSDISKLKMIDIRSTGYIVDTLEASLWCTMNSNSFEEAVSMAVNLGIDTDTIGAITGSLNGIIYSRVYIPNNWLDKIRKRGYIEELAQKFVEVVNNNRSRMK